MKWEFNTRKSRKNSWFNSLLNEALRLFVGTGSPIVKEIVGYVSGDDVKKEWRISSNTYGWEFYWLGDYDSPKLPSTVQTLFPADNMHNTMIVVMFLRDSEDNGRRCSLLSIFDEVSHMEVGVVLSFPLSTERGEWIDKVIDEIERSNPGHFDFHPEEDLLCSVKTHS